VPNAEFITGHVVNWTHRDVSRRMHIPFGVAYGMPSAAARTSCRSSDVSCAFVVPGAAHDGHTTAFRRAELNLNKVLGEQLATLHRRRLFI